MQVPFEGEGTRAPPTGPAARPSVRTDPQGENVADEPTSYGLAAPAPVPAPVPEPGTVVAVAGSGAGRLVGGRYRLLERLGAGGMGTVWRAHDEVVDRDVALKEPRVPDHFTSAERRTAHLRMEREARAAARIDHPSVVTIFDVATEDGRPWIVMELLRGHSLAETLEEGTLAPSEAARIGLAVLGALAAAHEAGVLHRDVKPGNVMLGRHGRVVLTDFGIAQVEGEQKLTETGAFIGSPEYLAPERVLGRRPGPASDLWSLGVLLYQAVEGVSPFRRQTVPSTLQAVLLAELPPPQQSGELTGLLAGLLRKEPEARLTGPDAEPLLHAAAAPPPRTLALPVPTVTDSGLPAAGPAPAPPPRLDRLRRGLRTRTGLAATGAGVLALAVLGALVVRLAGDGLPDGWKRYDEYRMRLSVAAPADWRIETRDDLGNSTGPYRATQYTSPAGDSWIGADRKERTTETARAIAERWKREHESATPPSGGSASVATVESTTEEGRDAAVITESYSQDRKGAPRRLSKCLILVGSRQERLTLWVDVPDGKNAAKTADDLLRKARSGYQVRDL
ncbi:protein kinase-like protein [Kitasatospora sp. SolWspMP-SS2h]|uniref:serine/threonine-protein kinase n=1 Tax=Kitasatospora sp. SolWspMP-SS2h TaxID=1305729 RepID=UPI000DBFFD4F|nr:serine/threonine-protein kinase [Kitasatospora sp. SolWspMP-SS2h]RAJ44095.1 protein kinase-like protein [Kitasatospora sp. SolWspMP-SS2h]